MTEIINRYANWPDWPEGRTAVIAEVGINHGGDEDLAWEMIKSAHLNGADFVKLQSFVTEEFFHPSLSYFDSTKSMELSVDSQRDLFRKAKSDGIKLITTPFDFASVDMVEEFSPSVHKIASMDNDNIPLIRYIAEKNRPVLISCGMADLGEIQKIVNIMEEVGNDKLVLLHCVSDYPAEPECLNLSMIDLLRNTFGYPIGLSDHSYGLYGSYVAASMGVQVIEKHFTTDRSLQKKYPDADHDISINPEEMKELRMFCESVSVMMGQAPRKFTENEKLGRLSMRRGIYAKQDICIDEKLSLENVAFLRPVVGMPVGCWDKIVGKKIVSNISKLQPIYYSDIGL